MKKIGRSIGGDRVNRNAWMMAPFFLLLSACGGEPKLMENTEEYARAHGIVPGQANELRIGGVLFRFPAGVGLNPFTYGKALAQPKRWQWKKEPFRPVKGQADRVVIHLNPKRAFAPLPGQFPSGSALRIEIRKWHGYSDPNAFDKAIKDTTVVEHPEMKLREYVSKNKYGSRYKSLNPAIEKPDGTQFTFSCQSNPPSFTKPVGLCFTGYHIERPNGKVAVAIIMEKTEFLEGWQETLPAVIKFVDSTIVK